MTTLEKAARLALAALESEQLWPVPHAANAAITALRAALAQQQAEPVAPWYRQFCNCLKCSEAPKQAEPVNADPQAVREAQQRARLASRLAGRRKGPSADTEFGVPHLAEDAEAEPVAVQAEDDLPDRLLQIHRAAASEAVANWQREQAEPAQVRWDRPCYKCKSQHCDGSCQQAEPVISKDAYDGAREDLAIWKVRALKAEELNRKFVASVNSQTYMGKPVQAEPVSALTRYNEIAENAETYTGKALERLRIFCSLAMTGEDWLDAEPFFDAAEAELSKLDVCLVEIDRLKQQAEPVAIPGAIPMAEVAARSRAMPERADALERARERLKQIRAGKFCDANCTAMDHHPDCQIGNPSF
jgi:hypothetical protein